MEKLDVELEVIKCKIHEEDLCESFKENLERKLNSKCEAKENVTSKKKNNIIKKPFYFYKAAAVFICFVMFSSCAFAGGVGDWLKELFSNVDKEMEIAYENGDIKEVETEYQTFDGVSVKVDYVSLKDNELYVVLNVKTEEEFDIVNINELLIEDNEENEIFDINSKDADINNNRIKYNIRNKGIDNKNKLIIFVISESKGKFNETDTINIKINNISIGHKNNMKDLSGNWNFDISLN